MSIEARDSIPQYPSYRSEEEFKGWFFSRFDTSPQEKDIDRWKINVEQGLRNALELPLLQAGMSLPSNAHLFGRN